MSAAKYTPTADDLLANAEWVAIQKAAGFRNHDHLRRIAESQAARAAAYFAKATGSAA